MGIKDLVNYKRISAYLQQDQCDFLDKVAKKANELSGKSLNRQDVLRFAIDGLRNRKAEHNQIIKQALSIVLLDDFKNNNS